jgi:hypothetical protein
MVLCSTEESIMSHRVAVILVLTAALSVAYAAPAPVPQPAPVAFLVQNPGLVFLGPDGREKERLDPYATNGAVSPNGRWLACVEFDTNPVHSKLVLRPRGRPDEPVSVESVIPTVGEGGTLVWSPDSRRLLIGENRAGKNGALEYSYHVYEPATKKFTELSLPYGHWVTGWSADGRRFLTTVRVEGDVRIAWLNADGTGNPDFRTPEDEFAYDARLSHDGRRMLYLAGPKNRNGGRSQVRLYVMDLESKVRVAVDEPGETHGYCWSPDGFQIAYTWQRSLDKASDVPDRETMLITCDRGGGNRKTITSRKYRVPENSSGKDGIVHFFCVVDWR